MSYAYSYQTNSIDKYESIQSDISDAYSYLDEVDEEHPPLDEFNDEDTDELASLYALSWEG